MNLGQLLGQQNLRIAELEERAERTPAANGPKFRRGLLARVKEALAGGPLTIDEVHALMPDVARPRLRKNMQVAASPSIGALVRYGSGREATYGLPGGASDA